VKVDGEFSSPAAPTALRTLGTDRDRLGDVRALSDLEVDGDGAIRGRFAPQSLFAGTTFDVVIRTVRVDGESAELHVSGRHGPHLVDVTLKIGFAAAGTGTRVTWSADVTARGPLASIGQRVLRDLAARAIGEVLHQAAAVAHA
jgi:carbon monoxide dehydrogenase subunit G